MLRDRFDRGERIAVRAQVVVKRKRTRPSATWFDVVLEKDEALTRSDLHFIRRGITIPDVRGSGGDKPVRALIVIDHEILSTFLGDAENPAHSDWSERADKLRSLYDFHATTLRFVKNSAGVIASLLTRPRTGRDRNLLHEVFSMPLGEDGTSTEATPRKGTKPATTPAGVLPGLAAGHARIELQRVAGGFSIRGAGDRRKRTAEVAYRIRSGNPMKKHSPFDFDLTAGGIAIDADGAAARAVRANALEFVARALRLRPAARRRRSGSRRWSPASAASTASPTG